MSSSKRRLDPAAMRAFEVDLNAKATCPSCGEGRLFAMDIGCGARDRDRHVFCDVCGARSLVAIRNAPAAASADALPAPLDASAAPAAAPSASTPEPDRRRRATTFGGPSEPGEPEPARDAAAPSAPVRDRRATDADND